jgi:hypothetical protein
MYVLNLCITYTIKILSVRITKFNVKNMFLPYRQQNEFHIQNQQWCRQADKSYIYPRPQISGRKIKIKKL